MNDTSFVWHPNTQMGEWDCFDRITSAKGVWLVDSRRRRMIDAVASMWCNVWGHSDAELVGAMVSQAKKMQHTPMFNLTHGPAEDLAAGLIGMSPGMHRVFYSDNGSSAMEVAFKMALQYWDNQGEGRGRIATLENGYHGDTFGAMSVGYVPEFFGRFRHHLFETTRLPVPDAYRTPKGLTPSEHQDRCLEKIESVLSRKDTAAFVMESGAQVAGGVRIYPKGFQREIGRMCKKYGVLLVLDEIATGFGRLGSMVQYAEQECSPDIVAYGKMLTGGYLTMAATLATKRVYDSFLGEFGDSRHLFHGHTYTGNPVAAAVADKNLRMYRKRRLIEKIQRTSKVFEEYRQRFMEHGMVGDVRHKGMLMGIDLVSDKKKKTPIRSRTSLNKILYEEGRRHGIYLRSLGNILLLVPPLAISESELHVLLERALKTIRTASGRIL